MAELCAQRTDAEITAAFGAPNIFFIRYLRPGLPGIGANGDCGFQWLNTAPNPPEVVTVPIIPPNVRLCSDALSIANSTPGCFGPAEELHLRSQRLNHQRRRQHLRLRPPRSHGAGHQHHRHDQIPVNALGQRIRKTNSQADTVFYYDIAGRLIADTSAGGTLKHEIIYLGDIPVGVVQ